MMIAQEKLLVVIPAYNEAASIGRVVTDLRSALPEADLLVVNDGSTDETASLAGAHGATVVSHPSNLGIGGAMQTGYLYALRMGYHFVCQLDGDGQHPPQEIRTLLEPLLGGTSDLVVGSRFIEPHSYRSSLPRRAGIAFFSGLVSLVIRQRITDATSGFRAMNRRALEVVAAEYPVDYPEPESFLLLRKRGLRIIERPVPMQARQGGRSSITPARSFYYMSKVTLAILVGIFRKC